MTLSRERVLDKEDFTLSSSPSVQNESNLSRELKARPIKCGSLATFVLETLLIVVLAVFAYGVQYDIELVPVTVRGFSCADASINYTLSSDIPMSSWLEWFGWSNELFFVITIGYPILVILAFEIAFAAFNRSATVHESFKRALRYIGAFLIAYFATSAITTIVQLIVGRLRPYFLDICAYACVNHTSTLQPFHNDISACGYITASNQTNYDDVKYHDLKKNFKQGRMSMPSYEIVITTMAATFVACYLSNRNLWQNQRWSRSLRYLVTLAAVLLAMLVAAERLASHRNHLEDVICGAVLGSFSGLFVVIMHFDVFCEVSSTRSSNKFNEQQCSIADTTTTASSNFERDLESNSDVYRYFQIPRVRLMLRNSIRRFSLNRGKKRAQQATELRTRGLTNPMFNQFTLGNHHYAVTEEHGCY